MYFDELFYYMQQIKKRKRVDYRMLLAIVQNPHIKEPEKLWEALDDPEEMPKQEEGIERLKEMLSQSRGIIIK